MANDIVGSLFGIDPNEIQAQRQAAAQQQAMQYARMDPAAQVNYGGYMAGHQVGNALMGMMGAKDPELEKASQIQSLVKDTDMTDLNSVKELIGTLTKAGFTKEAMSLVPRIDTLSNQEENRTARKEDRTDKIEARREEIQAKLAQEAKLATEKHEAAMERLRENNASKAELQAQQQRHDASMRQMVIEARRETARIVSSLKESKPERVDDKLGSAISVLEQQAPLIKTAEVLEKRIDDNKNLLTLSGRAGGKIDALMGNETPAVALQSDLKAFQNKARNAYLLLAKGTQTEGDANRAWEEFSTGFDWSSPEGAKRSITRIKDELANQVKASKAYVNARSPGRVQDTPLEAPSKPQAPTGKQNINMSDIDLINKYLPKGN